MAESCSHLFRVSDYDLAATLESGQAFRWERQGASWHGVLGQFWFRLNPTPEGIVAQSAAPVSDWSALARYLQVDVELNQILESLPRDAAMDRAVQYCRGLRLLRQPPWECLASFILSSTKQIVQIRQIVALLCERFGNPARVPDGVAPHWTFPDPDRLAQLSEADLRACKMGFRAPYLLETARLVAGNGVRLDDLGRLPVDEARSILMELPGVGRKIADCVLLFAYGFPTAFPIDVWVLKALRRLYFPRHRPSAKKLVHFTRTYFGANAGYAQQYLFHFMRTARTAPGMATNP